MKLRQVNNQPNTLNSSPREDAENGLDFDREWRIDENIKKMRDSFNRRLNGNQT